MVNLIKKERKGGSTREEANEGEACARAEQLFVSHSCRGIQRRQEVVFRYQWRVDWHTDGDAEQRGPQEEVVDGHPQVELPALLGGQLLPHWYGRHLPDHPLHHVHRRQWSQHLKPVLKKPKNEDR